MSKKKWYRLDNAAVAFPAIFNKIYTPQYRLSATLKDNIDKDILDQAIADLRKRFPTFFVSLKNGLFWHYLEELKKPLLSKLDYAYPLTIKSSSDLKKSCIQILYYENRIAVEVFHAVSDGDGGLIFFRNLVSRYLELKYNETIKKENGIYNLDDEPTLEEIEDAFPKCKAESRYVRPNNRAFHYTGEFLPGTKVIRVTGIMDSNLVKEKAHEYEVSVTAFLDALLIECLQEIQEKKVRFKKQRIIGVGVPYDLRRIFHINSLRNFALKTDITIDPKLPKYSFKELCLELQRQIKSETSSQKVAGAVSQNLFLQNLNFLKISPLSLKDIIINIGFNIIGEKNESITLSNIGVIPHDDIWDKYVDSVHFLISTGIYHHDIASSITYNGKLYLSFIRKLKNAELERLFFSKLVSLGIPVEIQASE